MTETSPLLHLWPPAFSAFICRMDKIHKEDCIPKLRQIPLIGMGMMFHPTTIQVRIKNPLHEVRHICYVFEMRVKDRPSKCHVHEFPHLMKCISASYAPRNIIPSAVDHLFPLPIDQPILALLHPIRFVSSQMLLRLQQRQVPRLAWSLDAHAKLQ